MLSTSLIHSLRSSVVEKMLLEEKRKGKNVSVIIVDSKPLLEGNLLPDILQNFCSRALIGKELLKSLTSGDNPIPCTYALLPALPTLLTQVSTVFLGAHSLFSNGAVYSRAGTAMVAMMARAHNVPVVVCCETYKFSEGVMVDGFSKNELGMSSATFLCFLKPAHNFILVPASVIQRTSGSYNPPTAPNLETLNPLYDLTPPTYITAVVTEVGLIPPSSISSIPLALGKTSL